MSNIVPFTPKKSTLDEAADWLAKVDRGLTAEEESQLRLFLSQPQAKAAFEELALLWDKMEVLSRLAQLVPQDSVSRTPPAKTVSRWSVALAASVVVMVSLTLIILKPFAQNEHSHQQVATYQTKIGEYAEFSLSDGSRVSLNTNSLLKVTYSAHERHLELQRGEAHFGVEHDPSRPFNVFAGDRLFQAVGTEFTVQLRPDKVELTVFDGLVRVNKTQELPHTKEVPLLETGDLLQAGEQGQYGKDSKLRQQLPEADLAQRLEWQSGHLMFNGEPLEVVIATISEYTTTEFTFTDEKAKSVPVAGRFKIGDIDGFLNALKDNLAIEYQKVGDNRVFLSAQKQ